MTTLVSGGLEGRLSVRKSFLPVATSTALPSESLCCEATAAEA